MVGTVVALETDSVQIRVDRIEGELPGVRVGDQRAVAIEGGPVAVGAQLLASPKPFEPEDAFAGEISALVRVGEKLTLRDETVTCSFDAATAKRSLSLDTVIEALTTSEPCVDVLASDDSAWNQRTCDGGEVAPNDEGCALTSVGNRGLLGVDLTSVTLLGALLLYRRRRQRAAIKSDDNSVRARLRVGEAVETTA